MAKKWAVVNGFYGVNGIIVSILHADLDSEQLSEIQGQIEEGSNCDLYIDWFSSEKDAQEFITTELAE